MKVFVTANTDQRTGEVIVMVSWRDQLTGKTCGTVRVFNL